MNRRAFERKLEELKVELRRLGERDLNERARAKAEGEIRADMRALRDQYAETNAQHIAAAEAALAKVTPGARRRAAIFSAPERYVALRDALANVGDDELPAYAELAAGENV